MKVLFIACVHSPFDHHAGSGKDYDLYQGLVRNGAEVEVAGPFPFSQTQPERYYRKLHALLFKKRPSKYPLSFLKKAADQTMRILAEFQPDIIFSKYAAILCRLNSDVPIVTLADTTLYGSHKEWPIFSYPAFLQQNKWEQKTYDRASQIIIQSRWSAEILEQHYRQPPEKVHILPAPASIPDSVVPEKILPAELEPLKILLVGRNYQRKGIDIALDVIGRLNQEGIPATLRVVGWKAQDSEHVRFMGIYNKTLPDQLQSYADNYRWANFLIHPARFEAAGIVPSEAAAFGVPTITNDIGGLGTTVADGISGVVLPKLSPPEAYVDVFRRYVNDPASYRKLCLSTRKRYDEELNWGVAGKRIYDIVRDAAKKRSG